MLVFGMKEVDYVVIDDNIAVRMKWEGNDVKLCIEAPSDVIVEGDKVYEQRCLTEGKEPRWRFDRLIKDKKSPVCPLDPLIQTNLSRRIVNKIPVWKENSILLLDPESILYFTVDAKKVTVHIRDDVYESGSSLAELEEKLENRGFFRCHKSFLVNVDHIARIVPWFNSTFMLRLKDSSAEIPVSRHYTKKLRGMLKI